MRVTAEYLHKKWNSIDFYDGGYIQIEAEHPLEWYAGFKEIDQKTLLMITGAEPALLPASKSILVSKGRRTDGRWTLSLTLMRAEQESVFETLCADIITYSQTDDGEDSALNLMVKRYKQWNKLLEHQRKSLMDENSRKGLLGELVVMHLDKCAPERNGAVSLGEQVNNTITKVREDSEALALLEVKLARYGYIDIPEYREQKYLYSGKRRFSVDTEFPRLTAANVNPLIVSAQYSIGLAGIEAWRLED